MDVKLVMTYILILLINFTNSLPYWQYQKKVIHNINNKRQYNSYLLLIVSLLTLIFAIYLLIKRQKRNQNIEPTINTSFSKEDAYQILNELKPKKE